MKTYKILWIDDEHEKQDGFIELAELNDIVISCFKTSFAGMADLKNNYLLYDAVILDAKGFDKSEDEVAKLTGLMSSISQIKELSSQKVIPYFIFSGQLDVIDNVTIKEMLGDQKIYRKSIDNDLLFFDLKQAADQQIDTQIRHNQPDIFSIFSLGYLSGSVELQVLELIKSELPTNISEIKAILTNIRSIHESCFLQLEAINVIPNSQTSFNNIIKHLSGNKTPANNYQPTTKEYQNDAIENLHKWIYFTCGKYIHNLPAVNYNGFMISRYGVESLRNGLLEMLLWFKKTYEENI
jgi:hypothetical protein